MDRSMDKYTVRFYDMYQHVIQKESTNLDSITTSPFLTSLFKINTGY